jgi:hypothetical protein
MTTIFIVHIAFEQLREMKQMRTGENYILRNIYLVRLGVHEAGYVGLPLSLVRETAV